jgi:hypothetical protein
VLDLLHVDLEAEVGLAGEDADGSDGLHQYLRQVLLPHLPPEAGEWQ